MTMERTDQSVQTDMTPAERRHLGSLEKRIASGLQTFREVGAALLEIRDERLYRETHSNFEAYCSEKWGLERSRAQQLIASAKVIEVLGDPDDLTNEAQAREMVPLVTNSPEVAKQVWDAVEARSNETGRPVTAGLIREVKTEVLTPGTVRPEQTPTQRLAQDMIRLGNNYQRWKLQKPNVGERQLINAAKRKLVNQLA